MFSMSRDITAPYSQAESWIYDTFIAPAVVGFKDAMAERLTAGVPADARVLDVGCGGGQIALALAADNPGWSVTGLDLSEDQIGRARVRARKQNLPVDFVAGSALDLPFPDGHFDQVYSVASIKHWPDPALGVAEMVRVLKPGGRLVVLEADRGCRMEDCETFVGRWGIPAPLRPLGVILFRTYVAGQAIDLEDARELLAGTRLRQAAVERVPGLPALVFHGTKPKPRAKKQPPAKPKSARAKRPASRPRTRK